jgi:hypothetical protein
VVVELYKKNLILSAIKPQLCVSIAVFRKLLIIAYFFFASLIKGKPPSHFCKSSHAMFLEKSARYLLARMMQ